MQMNDKVTHIGNGFTAEVRCRYRGGIEYAPTLRHRGMRHTPRLDYESGRADGAFASLEEARRWLRWLIGAEGITDPLPPVGEWVLEEAPRWPEGKMPAGLPEDATSSEVVNACYRTHWANQLHGWGEALQAVIGTPEEGVWRECALRALRVTEMGGWMEPAPQDRPRPVKMDAREAARFVMAMREPVLPRAAELLAESEAAVREMKAAWHDPRRLIIGPRV